MGMHAWTSVCVCVCVCVSVRRQGRRRLGRAAAASRCCSFGQLSLPHASGRTDGETDPPDGGRMDTNTLVRAPRSFYQLVYNYLHAIRAMYAYLSSCCVSRKNQDRMAARRWLLLAENKILTERRNVLRLVIELASWP